MSMCKLHRAAGQGRLITGRSLICTELQCSDKIFLVGKFLRGFNEDTQLYADSECWTTYLSRCAPTLPHTTWDDKQQGASHTEPPTSSSRGSGSPPSSLWPPRSQRTHATEAVTHLPVTPTGTRKAHSWALCKDSRSCICFSIHCSSLLSSAYLSLLPEILWLKS